MFADSRQADIRTHGTALVDLAWKVSQMSIEEEFSAAEDYSAMLDAHSSRLKAACADQGVMVN
ncbi:hypothetical protein [Micromonospora peucetia]|uniref:Uncharacterized protein n=1 Tax=Micromonospora peucetia TaxID=47871 RepID=A0A1C6VYK1_9ACTN|nr:hypothetical protein [Micromonospora peucetia]SCL71302.1 hypothetical protein GA0070608_4604 [Micromonospora peucetia]